MWSPLCFVSFNGSRHMRGVGVSTWFLVCLCRYSTLPILVHFFMGLKIAEFGEYSTSIPNTINRGTVCLHIPKKYYIFQNKGINVYFLYTWYLPMGDKVSPFL